MVGRFRRSADPQPPRAGDIKALLAQLHPRSTGSDLIRLGSEGDGGYLVPDDLDGIEACFSPGVGEIADFEQDCARLGMKVFMADGTVERPDGLPHSASFVKKNIGAISDDVTISLDKWVSDSLPESERDLILQMDIEGAEFEVLLSASKQLLKRFRIIVVEIHELHHIATRPAFDRVSRTFEKLLNSHFCVHIHPNNCCGSATVAGIEVPLIAEFTFLRRDRVKKVNRLPFTNSFPHPLDGANVPANEALLLPEALYRSKLR